MKSSNPVSRAYHRHRYEWVREKAAKIYSKGKKILDAGCGSCEWNLDRLPAVGLDISDALLGEALAGGRVKKAVKADFENSLPFGANSFDIVVLSEVLEHLENPAKKLFEIRRVMKNDGTLLLTVPYDEPFTLWHFIFPMQCFYMGKIRGNQYYAANCGHINHFGPQSLKAQLEKTGFEIETMKILASMNLAVVARKI